MAVPSDFGCYNRNVTISGVVIIEVDCMHKCVVTLSKKVIKKLSNIIFNVG